MMKIWSTEEGTELYGRGSPVSIKFAPDRRRDFQRTDMRCTLGFGRGFWIAFWCFLIGLGLLIFRPDLKWPISYDLFISDDQEDKVMVAGRDLHVNPLISSTWFGKIKNIRLNYVFMYKKSIYTMAFRISPCRETIAIDKKDK